MGAAVGYICRYSYRAENDIPSQPFTLLRWLISCHFDSVHIDGQVGKKPICALQPPPLFAQYDLVATTKNLNFFAPKLELLRKPDSLAISGFENPRGRHVFPLCIYFQVYT